MNNTSRFQDLKVALVYDHLTTHFGGAELVLKTLHTIFPKAPLFTSVYQLPSQSWVNQIKVKPSFLQKIPLIKKFHHILAPLHPIAFESFDLSGYDIIISISNGPSKGVLTLPHQLHVCYLLTPTRYLQQDSGEQEQYFKSHILFNFPGINKLVQPVLDYLKRWDLVSAHRPDVIIAISQLVASRVNKAYQREVNAIIYPPFQYEDSNSDTFSFNDFLLCLTRLTSYKRIDLAIQAAIKTNQHLVIAGNGIQLQKLIALAGNKGYVRKPQQTLLQALDTANNNQKLVLFVGNISETEKHQLLASCKALVMPGEEDFGLVGLEAASHGKPTITYYKSGIAEILKDKKQAIHTKEKSVKALSQAFQQLSNTTFSSEKIKESVTEYEVEWFKELFHKTIYHFWQQHSTISSVDRKS